MFSERYEDHFDELVETLSRQSQFRTFGDDKLIAAIRNVFIESNGSGLTFEDLDYLIDVETPKHDRVPSKIAWIMSHVLDDARVCGVNMLVEAQREGVWRSPVVEQVRRTGVPSSRANVERVVRSLCDSLGSWDRTVDAIAVSHDRRCVYLINGLAYSTLRRLKGAGAAVVSSPGLFESRGRVVRAPLIQSTKVRGLILAEGLVRTCFPQINVIPVAIIVDDIDAGWHFDAYNLTDVVAMQVAGRNRVDLSAFPLLRSSSRMDVDKIIRLPGDDSIQPFYRMPPDRRVRSLMILDAIVAGGLGNSKEVVPMFSAEIRKSVESRFDIYYSVDMARHDLSACKEGRRLVCRMPGTGGGYTCTPVGLARYYWARLKLDPQPAATLNDVMDAICGQSRLLWQSRGL